MSQESCAGDGSNGAEQQVRSSSSSDGAEAEAEEQLLPLVSVQMVGLGDIVERLVTFAYTELVTLVDTLPSRAADERRGEIVRYADHVTSLLTSLLVLVRWARSARQIQKCQNAIAYLDAQNRFFEGSVDSLYA
ncbi:mediator complex subunit, partial [Coemansia sp. RSA 2424]